MKIEGPKEARVNDTVTLTCLTSASNPRADIAWFKGGQQLEAASTTPHIAQEGGWTTSSNVSFKIEESDRSILVTCQGINRELVETKGDTHKIDVIRKSPFMFLFPLCYFFFFVSILEKNNDL